jgi:hypothetical protein
MKALGTVNEELAALVKAYEESKAMVQSFSAHRVRIGYRPQVGHLEKKREDLLKELEKGRKCARACLYCVRYWLTLRREINGLKDEVKFLKQIVSRRPRHADRHPALMPGFINRILAMGNYSKADLSTLSVVCKQWREACQGILFARFVNLIIDSRSKCEAIAAFFKVCHPFFSAAARTHSEFRQERPHIGTLVRQISLSFHAAHMPAGGLAANSVPLTLIPLIAACKKARALEFRALSVVASTRHVLQPLAENIEEIVIDPEGALGRSRGSDRPTGSQNMRDTSIASSNGAPPSRHRSWQTGRSSRYASYAACR